METFDEHVDVVVVGSGAGALVGAVAAASGGARVVVLEKTEWFGGTTALSGGGVWVPNNPVILDAGVPDTPEEAERYLRGSVGDRTPTALQDAFLQEGPGVIAWLEDNGYARFAWNGTTGFPDYNAHVPGGFAVGRTMGPVPVEDIAEIGDVARQIRPPLPRGHGGLNRVLDPNRLASGRALVGRLLAACTRLGVDLRLNHAFTDLVVRDGEVVGVTYEAEGTTRHLGARQGVLLAAGGFERNEELRREHQVVGSAWTVSAPGGTGDALRAGMRAGAAVDLLDDAWWTPSFTYPDGSSAFVLVERALPGAVIVDATGTRYANESLPYNTFGHRMLEFGTGGEPHIPSFLLVDQAYRDRYPLYGLEPGVPIPQEWFDAGIAWQADTVEELAGLIGVPAEALVATVSAVNEAAASGVDQAFGRGESFSDRRLVEVFTAAGGFDAPTGPNPCLAPLAAPPFVATRINPGDLGTKGGLVCDGRGRVQDGSGSPIPGLYATGNTMASVMGNDYPGPGSTLGPSIVFGYLAGRDAVTRPPSSA